MWVSESDGERERLRPEEAISDEWVGISARKNQGWRDNGRYTIGELELGVNWMVGMRLRTGRTKERDEGDSWTEQGQRAQWKIQKQPFYVLTLTSVRAITKVAVVEGAKPELVGLNTQRARRVGKPILDLRKYQIEEISRNGRRQNR